MGIAYPFNLDGLKGFLPGAFLVPIVNRVGVFVGHRLTLMEWGSKLLILSPYPIATR